MKKVLLIPAVVLALLFAGCKKEEPKPEQRWLRVYNDGEFEDSIDITGWEINDDVVQLGPFYYPWQGEDSIDYNTTFHSETMGIEYNQCWWILNVNGKLVGVDPYLVTPSEIECHEWIVTLIGMGNYNYDIIRHFPNLVGVTVIVDSSPEVKNIELFPLELRLYVDCRNISNADLRSLARLNNVRVLDISRCYENENCQNPTASGFRVLRRMKELRILLVHGLFEDSEEIEKYIKPLPNLRVKKVWNSVEFQ